MGMGSHSSTCWVLKFVFVLFVLLFLGSFASASSSSSSSSSTSPSSLHPLVFQSQLEHLNHTAISEFRVLNRRFFGYCPNPSPYLQISVNSSSGGLGNEEFVTVNVSGVLKPSKNDWVAMISPSNSDVSSCPGNSFLYVQTGDFSNLPLLCHYPVKVNNSWSLSRITEYGYLRGHATKTDIKLEFVNADTRKVEDSFHITKA